MKQTQSGYWKSGLTILVAALLVSGALGGVTASAADAKDAPAEKKAPAEAQKGDAGLLDPNGGGASPSNDNFGNAEAISALPYSDARSTSGATTELGEPEPCGYIGSTVWYRFDATASEFIDANTFGSGYDTVLAVYTGSHMSNLALVDCNDDMNSLQSQVEFSASAGTTYWIQVGGYSGATGSLDLSVTGSSAPANDNFADSEGFSTLPYASNTDTTDASMESGEPAPCGYIGSTVWYHYDASTSGNVDANTFGSGYDTVLAVYTGSSLGSLSLVDCNDDAGSLQSQVVFSASAGTTYWIQVGGYGGATGSLDLSVSAAGSGGGGTPANDNFADATAISGFPATFTQSTVGATMESGEPAPCGHIGSTVWFTFVAPDSQRVVFDTFGSDYDTVLAVHTGATLSGLTTLACNDDASGYQSEVGVSVTAGETYYVQVGGYGGDTGNLVLDGRGVATQGNDNRADALDIDPLPYSDSQNTDSATLEAGEPRPCGYIGRTVWYRMEGTLDNAGVRFADTFASGYDTVLAVYAEVDGELQLLSCNDDFPMANYRSAVTWAAVPGVTYYLQVGGYGGQGGDLELHVS